jgi:hypothetical protein
MLKCSIYTQQRKCCEVAALLGNLKVGGEETAAFLFRQRSVGDEGER